MTTYPAPFATVTAVYAGRKADGSPLDRRLSFALAREPEHDFGPGRTRLHFYRWVPSLGRFDVHAAVVMTDSIREA